jgi:hypothetical protein
MSDGRCCPGDKLKIVPLRTTRNAAAASRQPPMP